MKTLTNYAKRTISIVLFLPLILWQCEWDNEEDISPRDPDKAELAVVDRFSDDAATLMKRSKNPDLPGPNEPIDFDQEPFITKGLGPNGNVIKYYNFDVQPTAPVPVYVFFRKGSDTPLEEQLNILDQIPGDPGYNDLWQMYKVIVPKDYVANTVTSYQEIQEEGFDIQPTSAIVNCPVVPKGSTASLRLGSSSKEPSPSWYKGKVVYYFYFRESELEITNDGLVPTSPIYVSFNTNPESSDPSSGPPSGFMTEQGSNQTHNVVATLPSDSDYSPLWQVYVYNNADFDSVSDLASAESANILNTNAGYVNCPVVYKE